MIFAICADALCELCGYKLPLDCISAVKAWRRYSVQHQECFLTTRGTRFRGPSPDPACTQRPFETPAYWRPRHSRGIQAENADWIGPAYAAVPASDSRTRTAQTQ